MPQKNVAVAIYTPNDKNLKPYVYGVFNSSEAAHLYFECNGDVAGGTLRSTTETYIDASEAQIGKEYDERKAKEKEKEKEIPVDPPSVDYGARGYSLTQVGTQWKVYLYGKFLSEHSCLDDAQRAVIRYDEDIAKNAKPNIPACTNKIDMDQH